MRALIVLNMWSFKELDEVKAHDAMFGDKLRIVTPLNIDFGNVWQVPDSMKLRVEWTKRFLRRFLQESHDVLVKIDPDTVIKKLPDMPADCDVAGDFRKSSVGWVWLGACQYYTRSAVEKILSDPLYINGCYYQDAALASVVCRTGLRAFNMPEIDGWSQPGSTSAVTHRAKSSIPKQPAGFVEF